LLIGFFIVFNLGEGLEEFVSCFLCLFLIVLQNRMQANGIAGEKRIYNSSIHCIKTIVQKEGFFLGLFGGCWANVVKAVPGAALQFAVFDLCKHVLKS
jgi:hypothetical protein